MCVCVCFLFTCRHVAFRTQQSILRMPLAPSIRRRAVERDALREVGDASVAPTSSRWGQKIYRHRRRRQELARDTESAGGRPRSRPPIARARFAGSGGFLFSWDKKSHGTNDVAKSSREIQNRRARGRGRRSQPRAGDSKPGAEGAARSSGMQALLLLLLLHAKVFCALLFFISPFPLLHPG